jgi:hypothetical protein
LSTDFFFENYIAVLLILAKKTAKKLKFSTRDWINKL